MQCMERENSVFPRCAGKACLLSGILMALLISGCGGSTTTKTSTTTSSSQTYFAPVVVGITGPQDPQTYTFADGAGTFSRTTYYPENEVGPQVLNAGTLAVGERGLRSLEITANYSYSSATGLYEYSPAAESGFAVELAGQTGGLVQLYGQPVTPLVAATQCPSFTSAQSYRFITIPMSSWASTTDTAYGSVDIVTSGSAVTFQNIVQHTLPSVGGTGTPSQPSASSVTGACGSTTLGYITGVPGQYVVEAPGSTSTAVEPPQAAIGIGTSGLLVEDNGYPSTGTLTGTSPALHYENVLGAGTGAVGLPKPSSDITSAVVGAQYLGFIRGAGTATPSSHLASFSYSSASSSCAKFTAQTGTLINGIYGGDYTNDDPTTSTDGFGNCDFAIDLGTQDSSNYGLYSQATVHMGASYRSNPTGNYYHFSAVAIAGQIDKKNAIFVLGVDSTQPWAIYLLQSN